MKCLVNYYFEIYLLISSMFLVKVHKTGHTLLINIIFGNDVTLPLPSPLVNSREVSY